MKTYTELPSSKKTTLPEIENLSGVVEEKIKNVFIKNIVKKFLENLESQEDQESQKEIDKINSFIDNYSEDHGQKCEAFVLAIKMMRSFTEGKSKPSNRDIDRFDSFVKSVGVDFCFQLTNESNGLLHCLTQIGGPLEFLEVLKNNNADFASSKSDYLNTPLLWAIANAQNDFAVSFLDFSSTNSLDVGIDHRAYGHNTALHLAAAKGYVDQDYDKVKLRTSSAQLTQNLINNGANPNILNDLQYSPLDLAVIRGDLETTQAICSSSILSHETITKAQTIIEERQKNSQNNPESAKEVISLITPEKTFLNPNAGNFTIENIQELQNLLEQTKSKGPSSAISLSKANSLMPISERCIIS